MVHDGFSAGTDTTERKGFLQRVTKTTVYSAALFRLLPHVSSCYAEGEMEYLNIV